MTFYNLYNELSSRYPVSLRCDWDNDGIMCAYDLNAQSKRVLIALDVTMDTVDYAIQNKFDTIISHHPLVFRSQKGMSEESFTQRKLIKLIQNGINVMSFHTRLDAVYGGVNDVIAKAIGFENTSVDENEPIGRIGEFEQPLDLQEFASKIKAVFKSPIVLYAGGKAVKRVYIVGGDGKDLIENAISYGADTLLTGRASYNTMIDAKDMGINIIEAGHFFTENPVCEKIKSDVESICCGIEIEIFNSFNVNIVK